MPSNAVIISQLKYVKWLFLKLFQYSDRYPEIKDLDKE